jgi:hypothetical protein
VAFAGARRTAPGTLMVEGKSSKALLCLTHV